MNTFRTLAAGLLSVAFFGSTAVAYDSSSYVQEGLLSQWDGIDNAGKGYHDANATSWKDLKGSYDMALTSHGCWGNGNSLVCDGGGASASYGAIGLTTYQTIEVVYRQTGTLLNSAGFIFDSGNPNHMVLSAKDGKSLWFGNGNGRHLYWAEREGSIRSIAATYATAASNSSVSSVVSNGVVIVDASSKSESWNAGTCHLMVGDRSIAATYPFAGEIFAIRLYSSVLTAEQLAANFKVDSVRFMGAKDSDVLDVCAAPFEVPTAISPSYAGRDNLSNGDTVTLTAPSGEIAVGNSSKAFCTGFKLYDSDGTIVDSGAGNSYSYTHPGEYRKFEWQFAVSNRVTVAGAGGSYSVTDTWVGYGDDLTFTITPDDGKAVASVSNSADGETWKSTTVTKKIVRPVDFTVSYANCYYVSPTGNDANDGTTHATPKATVSAAIALASAGDSVVLLRGTYAQEAAVVKIAKAITVYGEDGQENTFVNLNRNVGAFSLEAAGACLRGITFYSDYSTSVGRVLNITAVATAEDILVRDCNCSTTTAYAKNGGIFRNVTITHVKTSGRMMSGFEIENQATLVENCRAYACQGDNNAYGCSCYIWSGTVRNSLFACNTNKSSNAAGVFIASGSLENCTVVDNVVLASGTTGGVKRNGGTVKNCLIYGNKNRAGVLNWTGDASAYTYNCTVPVPSGNGNILAVNPDFADPETYDYSLKSGNAIDAGTALAWHTGARDLAGGSRVNGHAVDIGCYESVPGALSVSAVPSEHLLVGAGNVTLTAYASGADLSGISYSWTVKDDAGNTVAEGTGATFTRSYDNGRYSVTLQATTPRESATWTGEKAFSVIPMTVYVAQDSTPAYPYATKATAANDLPTAMEATVDGSTVIVCDGTYAVNANIPINNAIAVRSENGPGKTVFYTNKAISLLSLANKNAVFEGITLCSDGTARNCQALNNSQGLFTGCVVSNFYSNGSEIILLTSTSSVVSNCTITANRDSGRINLIEITDLGGNVLNCRIVGNQGNNNAYASAIQLYGGVGIVRNCLIACNTNLSSTASAIGTNSGPTKGTTIENCTIVGNYVAGSSSVGAVKIHANMTIRNCVIVDNHNTGGEANWDTTGANVSYTCTMPEPCANAGNVEPSGILFADGEYHIKAGILTDSGLNQPWMAGARDLDGNARIYDNGTVDMGCYEYIPGALEVSAAPSPALRVGAGEVVLTAIPNVQSDDFVYSWTVTNQLGETVASVSGANYLAYTNSYPIGEYSVSLTVTDGNQTASFHADRLFAVKPTVVYVAPGATPAYPYDTKSIAFDDVSEAIAFAESGMRVVVTDGVYTNASNPTISKNVVIESENGPERTKIFGVNRTIAWTINSSDAVVRGFTLYSDKGAGISSPNERESHAISVLQGLVDDCVISNWFSYYTVAINIGGGVSPGVVSNCLITANKSSYRCYSMSMNANGALVNSRVVENLCDTESRDYGAMICVDGKSAIRNTLIADNRSVRGKHDTGNYASVIDIRTGNGCNVDNCTIVSNTASNIQAPAIWCQSNSSFHPDFAKSLKIRNSIVWHNSNAAGILDWQDIANCFTNSCSSTPGLAASKGNFSDDPCLVWRKTTLRPKYSLRIGSPCIDAGAEYEWMPGTKDLAGRGRKFGTGIDLGAYEFHPSPRLMYFVK